MMKRIVFSTYDDLRNPFFGGGGARAIHEVAKRLSDKYEVKIVCGNYSSAKDEVIDGITYEHIGISVDHPQIGQIMFQACLPFAIHNIPHDLWIESFTPPFSCAFLPLMTKRPVIGLVHLLSGAAMAAKYKVPLFPLIERWGISYYKYLIALTSTSRKNLNRIAPKSNIAVISNGVEKGLLRHNKQVNKIPYYLYLGRIDILQKGLDTLLLSFDHAAKIIPHRLVIVGKGDPREVAQLRCLIGQLKHAQRIKYVQHVRGKKKHKLLSQASALVLPSRFETQPLVILEAFALRCPVLLSQIKDFEWISRNLCYKVKPENEKSLARALVQIGRNPSLSNERVRRAFSSVDSCTWDSIAQQYMRFIQSVFDGHSQKGIEQCISY